MSNPWGTVGPIGSWAAEAELAEAEEKELAATSATPQSFPSLKEAINTKPKKKKMSLSEFSTYGSSTTTKSSYSSTRLTPNEMLHLPTAPQPRSPDDYSGAPRLGGGFSNYGDDRRRRGPFDDDRRPPRREYEAPPPSRADEVDNWASSKREMPLPESGRSSGRYSSLGGGSRADDTDNWNMGKRPVQVQAPMARSSTFGSGFRDSGSGFRDSGSGWRGERESGDVERPRLVLNPPSGGGDEPPVPKTNKPNPFGAARPREEVLAEKGLDWKKLDLDVEEKKATSVSGSRPASSHGSRPTSSQSNRSESVGGEGVGVQKPKVNPFGDAKPREVLLEEKGMDWRKIDLDMERRRLDRPETDEEKTLKEEIESLKKELEKQSGNDASPESGGTQNSLRDQIQVKEKDLEVLIQELDDRVRHAQKAAERPSSGAGRFTSFPDRRSSQSGSFEESRVAESMDRSQSRVRGDVWTRPNEDRRGGFLSNRDSDRSSSGNRW